MGKKRIASKGDKDSSLKGGKKGKKRKLAVGVLNVLATYNNTIVTLADPKGNSVAATSAGALGFRGAKKATPFAAAKVGETVAEKAESMGLKEVSVVVKGVGSGREAAIRSFVSGGIAITSIQDQTPVPHNGPTRRKPRRV